MKPAPNQPRTSDLKIVDGIFVKVIDVPDAWTLIPQHSHAHDHVSLIATGAVQVYVGRSAPFEAIAPCALTIVAGVKHSFLSLEPNTRICCIHNVERTGEVEVLEEHQLELEH
jgi:hypothetical protein